MIDRILAFDAKGKPPTNKDKKARAILESDTFEKAFLALSPIEKHVIATLVRPTMRMTLGWTILGMFGATEGDLEESDRALGMVMRDVTERWPIVASLGYSFSSVYQLVSEVADVIRPHALELLAVPRVMEPVEEKPSEGPLALALALGLVLQRGRMTAQGEIHGSVEKKLVAILPRVSDHARVFRIGRALDRDESGTPVLDLRAARAVIGEMAGFRFLEATSGGYIDPEERALLAIGMQAGDGAVLDLAAAMRVAGTTIIRLDRVFRLVRVDPRSNRLSVPHDVFRLLRASASTDQRSFVQPDFEVVLSPSAGLEDAMIMGCAAELVHLGTVARLRLTQASVQKGCANGIAAEALVESLERVAGRALPGNVKQAVVEWGASIGRGELREAIMLSFTGEASRLDRAAKILEPLTLHRPSPGLFLLGRLPRAKQLEQLRAIGLHVKTNIEARRARELEQLHGAMSEPDDVEDDELYDHAIRRPDPPAELPTIDVRFSDAPIRAVDMRRLGNDKRLEKLLQRSVPQSKPLPATAQLRISDSVSDSDSDSDSDDTDLDVLRQAFDVLRKRFANRRDWLDTLDVIEDLDATRYLQVEELPRLLALILHASTPATLQLAIVNAAEQHLLARKH